MVSDDYDYSSVNISFWGFNGMLFFCSLHTIGINVTDNESRELGCRHVDTLCAFYEGAGHNKLQTMYTANPSFPSQNTTV